MSFSFGFLLNDDNDSAAIQTTPTQILPWWQYYLSDNRSVTDVPVPLLKINPPSAIHTYLCEPFMIHELSFKKIIPSKHHRIDETSDLIPGQYEGGLKIWECTLDLIQYMKESQQQLPSILTSRVIELGCGQGFPGIFSLQLGYQYVMFSDFNQEVIEDITWPNILLNCDSNTITHANIECYSGDWIDLHYMFTTERSTELFELILSAETLYSIESSKRVLYFLWHHLSPTGIALLATKRFYFGVGGGTYEFESLINSLPSLPLKMNIVSSYEDGASNIRDIIVVQRNSS